MSTNNINSIFGATSGLAGMIGDYNAIRSGNYKKLLQSYYGKGTAGTSSSNSQTKTSNVLDQILEERRNPKVSAEVSNANAKLSSAVGGLKSGLSSLQNESLYKDTENGSTARSKVTSSLKSYVAAYNDAVESSKKTTMSNVSSNIAGAMRATKENADALKEIGINIQNDGTIYLDEKKLQTVELDKVKSVFDGDDALSYGSKVASRLNRAFYYVSETTAQSATDSTSSIVTTKSNSKNLMESIANLKSDDFYEKTTEGVLGEVESFIKYYNSTIASAKNSSISGVTANLASMMQKTANNAGNLAKVGISVGADGKLKLDKEAFQNEPLEQSKDTLGKYASAIESNANLLNYYATTQNQASSGYSANGSYQTNPGDIVSQLYDKTVN